MKLNPDLSSRAAMFLRSAGVLKNLNPDLTPKSKADLEHITGLAKVENIAEISNLQFKPLVYLFSWSSH